MIAGGDSGTQRLGIVRCLLLSGDGKRAVLAALLQTIDNFVSLGQNALALNADLRAYQGTYVAADGSRRVASFAFI